MVTIPNPTPATEGNGLEIPIAPLAQGTHPATSTGPVDSPEPEPPCKHVLGKSLAHSNASPSIFVPSHMPGLCFPPLSPSPSCPALCWTASCLSI